MSKAKKAKKLYPIPKDTIKMVENGNIWVRTDHNPKAAIISNHFNLEGIEWDDVGYSV